MYDLVIISMCAVKPCCFFQCAISSSVLFSKIIARLRYRNVILYTKLAYDSILTIEDLGRYWLDQIRWALVLVCTEHALFVTRESWRLLLLFSVC